MNAEHRALAEYLKQYLDERFDLIDKQFDQINIELVTLSKKFKPVGRQLSHARGMIKDIDRKLNNFIQHVDTKNDKQDEILNYLIKN